MALLWAELGDTMEPGIYWTCDKCGETVPGNGYIGGPIESHECTTTDDKSLTRREHMSKEELKQKLESVANVVRTTLLIERGISSMTRTALGEIVSEIDAMSAEWAYDSDED